MVVGDQKQASVAGSSISLTARLLSYNNYYPFGLEQPGRTWQFDAAPAPEVEVAVASQGQLEIVYGRLYAISEAQNTPAQLSLADSVVLEKHYQTEIGQDYRFRLNTSLASGNNPQMIVAAYHGSERLVERPFNPNEANVLDFTALDTTVTIRFTFITEPDSLIALNFTNMGLFETDASGALLAGVYRFGFNGKENDREWGNGGADPGLWV
ncbi:MAG: hypothetical protein HC880_16135 [Bacteroidia bacterium]|nr:hypothetical protein [Bacteroidia bacterium]